MNDWPKGGKGREDELAKIYYWHGDDFNISPLPNWASLMDGGAPRWER